jgi:serine/threonine-protein kinase CTR1
MLYILKGKENIVKLKAYLTLPYCIVMEFAEFGDLSNYLRSPKSKDMSLLEKYKIGEDLANALNVLHSFKPKIVHRDIKSLNILVFSVNPITVKLSDFETACFVTTFSNQKSAIDNPVWSAPEFILGTRQKILFFFFLF